MEQRKIICISRSSGSGGREVGSKLAAALGIPFHDKELLARTSRKQGIDLNKLETLDEQPVSLAISGFPRGLRNPYTIEHLETLYYSVDDQIYHIMAQTIREMAEQGSCVIIGRAANEVLKDDPDLLSIFVHADLEDRVRRVAAMEKIDAKLAEKLIQKIDKKRASYHNHYSSKKWGESASYDLSLSTSKFGIDGVVELIVQALGKVAAPG